MQMKYANKQIRPSYALIYAIGLINHVKVKKKKVKAIPITGHGGL
jgi:hypothetical protein